MGRCVGLRGAHCLCPKQGQLRKRPRQILETKPNTRILCHDRTEPQNGKRRPRRPLHSHDATLDRRSAGLMVAPFLGWNGRNAGVWMGRGPIGVKRRRAYRAYDATRQMIQELTLEPPVFAGGSKAVDNRLDRHPVRPRDIHLLVQHRPSSEHCRGTARMWTRLQYRFSAILGRLDGGRTSSDPPRPVGERQPRWHRKDSAAWNVGVLRR